MTLSTRCILTSLGMDMGSRRRALVVMHSRTYQGMEWEVRSVVWRRDPAAEPTGVWSGRSDL